MKHKKKIRKGANAAAPIASGAVVKGQKGAAAGAKGERGDGVVAVAAGLEKIGLELGVKKPRKHVLVGQVKI